SAASRRFRRRAPIPTGHLAKLLEEAVGVFKVLGGWPVLRQVGRRDLTGLDGTACSDRTEGLRARIAGADRVIKSVCPYCAVGCGQKVYVEDGRILDIEGDEDSPISRGRLCPKGAATFQLV